MLELTAPALLLAGIATSPHCAAMCGSLQALSSPPSAASLLMLNAGRLLGYAALGALAGAAGARALSWLPGVQLAIVAQLMAAAVLALSGAKLLRRRAGACAGRGCPRARPALPQVLRGLAWAAMPCGFLYATLLLAALSGGAWQGAMLLLAFGLGTLPLLLLGSTVLQRLRTRTGAVRRCAGAALLVAGGAVGVMAWLHPADQLWCLAG